MNYYLCIISISRIFILPSNFICNLLMWCLILTLPVSCQMILFSACCICGLIGGILNFQFLRAVAKRTTFTYPIHLASMSMACLGIAGCTLSAWLTCRLASNEQQRMFLERDHSLHHSHEMTEKVCNLFATENVDTFCKRDFNFAARKVRKLCLYLILYCMMERNLLFNHVNEIFKLFDKSIFILS